MLLDGIDLSRVRRPKKWSPPETEGDRQLPQDLIKPERWQRANRRTSANGANGAEKLEGELGTLTAKLAALERHVFGKRSEKLPSVGAELRKGSPKSREATLKERREKRAAREELPTREIQHKVPDEKRVCPKCGSRDLRALGEGRQTVVYEYVPARIERQVHVQETLSCPAAGTASSPRTPRRRLRRAPVRTGLHRARGDRQVLRQHSALSPGQGAGARRRPGGTHHDGAISSHAAARSVEPLYVRLLELVREAEIVRADETPQRVLAPGKTKRGYVWTFRTEELVAYQHSASRSGETPADVLAGTKGYLVVDGYTGYNRVTAPEGRIRVGCWAHVRRKFFDAVATAPESQGMLDLILALYRVEQDVNDAKLAGTDEHLRRRSTLSASITTQIQDWLVREAKKHPPKSPIGEAIRYTQGQWDALTRFLEKATLPLDNNLSENALRAIALGRKNYLFVGNDEAGENLAGLQSLIATCERNGVNPEAYLADVLMRVQTHPNARLDELLPHRWTAPANNSS